MEAQGQSGLLELQQVLYESRNPTRRWLHHSRRDWVLDEIREQGRAAARALEIGPGSGIYLPMLCDLAQEVTASDVEEAYLSHARELAGALANLHCVRDDITATSLPPKAFDLIVCSEVIEHIPDSAPVLQSLATLLAPDGVLVLTTPQRFSPLELCARVAFLPGIRQLIQWIYREPLLPLGHINLLTEAALLRQVRDAGLSVRKSHKTGFYLPGIAEFGGVFGQRFLAWCGGKLLNSPMSGILWTQCYVLGHASTGERDG